MSIVAYNVKRIISEKGLKQKYVGRLAGFEENQMSAMMNDRKIITDESIVEFARVLNVEYNELFKPPTYTDTA